MIPLLMKQEPFLPIYDLTDIPPDDEILAPAPVIKSFQQQLEEALKSQKVIPQPTQQAPIITHTLSKIDIEAYYKALWPDSVKDTDRGLLQAGSYGLFTTTLTQGASYEPL